MTTIVSGYVEIDDGLRPFEIINSSGDIVVYESGDLRDDFDCVTEFIEEVGGIYYTDKNGYRAGAGNDLSLAVLEYVLNRGA
jgi:GTPase SAR1 family protein